MFDSLDDQIRIDEHKMTSNKERAFRFVLVLIITVVVFGGIYFGVHLMEGT